MLISIQERFVIKSRLWWHKYGMFIKIAFQGFLKKLHNFKIQNKLVRSSFCEHCLDSANAQLHKLHNFMRFGNWGAPKKKPLTTYLLILIESRVSFALHYCCILGGVVVGCSGLRSSGASLNLQTKVIHLKYFKHCKFTVKIWISM